tara:strand:+ start:2532 stop:3275 length:744 start_codon:yes stop_codon:yes gene_type:complete
MNKKIIGLIVLALLSVSIYFIVVKVKQSKKGKKDIIGSLHNGKIPFTIKSKDIPASEYGNEYTINFWLYMNDWEYRNTKPKSILFRGDRKAISTNPGIWFYPRNNKIKISFQLQSDKPTQKQIEEAVNNCSKSMNPINNPNMLRHHRGSCDIKNIPLQRWNNITITLWNQTVDVYLNGGLVRSCIMPEYPVPSSGDIFVSHFGGFNGYISDVKYFAQHLTSREIQKIYNKGPNLKYADDKKNKETST